MFSATTVTHHTNDTLHPLIMVTNRDGHRYFFGKVPEGTQRAINSQKIKLGKLKLVFLTGAVTSWLEIGGLPGLFLTLTDATNRGIHVFANCRKILTYVVATWRSFVFRKGANLDITMATEDGLFGDNNVAVKAIRIPASPTPAAANPTAKADSQLQKLISLMFPLDTSKVNSEDPFSYKTDPTDTEIHTHVALPSSQTYVNLHSQDAVSYCVRFLPLRGKFDVNKAKALGLEPGLKYKELALGKPVQNAAGDTILPEQVVLAPQPFLKMLVIDCPTPAYFENTIKSEKWLNHGPEMGAERVGLVYHLLGPDIDYMGSQYQLFIKTFDADCIHVVSHPSLASNTLVFKKAAENLLILKTVLPSNYNLLNSTEYHPFGSDIANHYVLQLGQEFSIWPDRIEYDESRVFSHTWLQLYDATIPAQNIPNADKQAITAYEPLLLQLNPAQPMKDQVHVVTLGTGSSLPSIFRNVISTLVRIPRTMPDGSTVVRLVLFDGGENTLGALLRNFGHNGGVQLRQVLGELLLINLLHLHADHHLGLVSVINEWFKVNCSNTQNLYIVAPWQYDTFMKEWYGLETQFRAYIDTSRLKYISCEDFLACERKPQYRKMSLEDFEARFDRGDIKRMAPKEPLRPIDQATINEMFSELGISDLQTCRALHCAWAYSSSITFDLTTVDSFKVSYSGDTRPNPKFVDIGYNSDLLIHESSLDKDLIEEAISKKHSTMIEALSVARFMNCPKVVLTHFSTRYSNNNNISVAASRLMAEAAELAQYMKSSRARPDIFAIEAASTRPIRNFDQLEVCFAFDYMNVWYNDMSFQYAVQEVISRIFAEEDLDDLEKRSKKDEKVAAKREKKRSERVGMKRKSSER